MKHKPKHRPRAAAPKMTLGALLRQPPADFYRLPDLTVRGGTVLTEGCRKVLEFDAQKISMDMGRFVVTFYGRELRIESLNGKRVAVAGRVTRIDFAAKWEGQDASL